MTRLMAAFLGGVIVVHAQEASDEKKREILNKLTSIRLSVDFTEQDLEAVLDYIRDFADLNIVLDAKVYERYAPNQLKVTLKVKDLTLKAVLKLALGGLELTAIYREGVLVVVPKEAEGLKVFLRVYDIRDLLLKIQDFPGPKLELKTGTSGLDTGPIASLEEPQPTITEDFLTDLVKSSTGGRSWEENPNVSISLSNGLLFVSQSRKVHQEIERLLQLLRQYK